MQTTPPPPIFHTVNVKGRNSGRKMYWLIAIVTKDAAIPIIFRILSLARRTTATTSPVMAVTITNRTSVVNESCGTSIVLVSGFNTKTKGYATIAKNNPNA